MLPAQAQSQLGPGSVNIGYEATDLGAGHWQYTYSVGNAALASPIQEFTIWFYYGWYENLATATPNPPAAVWSELVAQPDPLLSDDGFYDALALAGGIPVGGSESGFSVLFDWHGPGTPGGQPFAIVDPATYQTIYSGTTVPEPTAVMLLAVAGLLIRRQAAQGSRR
jgi:hypothetical protein